MRKFLLLFAIVAFLIGVGHFRGARYPAQSFGVAEAQCTNGTTLVYDTVGGRLTTSCKPGSGAGTAPFTCTVTAVSSIVCTHSLGTTTPWVVCFDGSGNQLGSTGAATSVISVVATSSNVATITFSGTTTGSCVISTGSTGPIGATGSTGATGATGSSTGNVTGPNTNSAGFIPTWNGANSLTLANGISVASLAPTAGCGTSASGSAISINPFDLTCAWIYDEMYPGAAATGTIGQSGFTSLSIGTTGCGSTSGAAPETNHPGIYKSTTATSFVATPLGCGVSHNGNGNGSGDFGDLSTQTNWTVWWVYKTGPSLTNIKIRVGIIPQSNAGTQADPPADGVWIRYISGTDTNWTVTENTGSTAATVDSGVSIAVSTWYAVRIRSTTVGTWLMSVATAGGAFSAEKTICSSGCDVTATLTAVTTLGPGWQVITGDTTAKSISIDLYAALFTGMTR